MPANVYAEAFIIRPPEEMGRDPQLRRLSRELSNLYAEQQVVTDEILQAVGGTLWGALEIDSSFEQAYHRSGTGILPIVIESDSAAVMALPWETLLHPSKGFLGRSAKFSLSRRHASPAPTPAALEKGPLRALLFTSLPDDLRENRLNVEGEQANVQEALLPLIAAGTVDLKMPDDGRFETFQRLLREFQPHLLFLSGHGSFVHQPHAGEAYGNFLFESATGKSQPVRDSEVAAALVGTAVQAVVLLACESGKATSDDLNAGLMQAIAAQGVPHVIGMRESVYDQAGIQFARALCTGLGKAERADVSLQAARQAITKPFAGLLRRDAQPVQFSELSFGQWALPLLLSPAPERPLIDWEFTPHKKTEWVSESLSNIALPAKFVGRRKELRERKSRLFDGSLKKLLITGAGGQGKTSLAGKLAKDLQQAGYRVFAWSARVENSWRDFELAMEFSLDVEDLKKYDYMKTRFRDEQERISFFLKLLNTRFDGKVVVFLDNLESLQEEKGLRLKVAGVQAWVDALLADPNAILLATSRWELPNWSGEILPLAHASYGDFLQMAANLAEQGKLPYSFAHGEKLSQAYAALGGNGRGLGLFAGAIHSLNDEDAENAFLEKLAESKTELQADMAIATIYENLAEPAQAYLRRLVNFVAPVGVEGLRKLIRGQGSVDQGSGKQGLGKQGSGNQGSVDQGLGNQGLGNQGLGEQEAVGQGSGEQVNRKTGEPQNGKTVVTQLLAVSLLEAQENKDYDALEYSLSPLVRDWLQENDLADNAPQWRQAAADYHEWLYREERHTLSQAMTLHAALLRAERQADADRIALDSIVGRFNRAGLYQTLLQIWLPAIANSPIPQTQAEALGQIGKQHLHLGNFKEAMPYFQRSLAISQEIGDKAGLCATLFNMGHIHIQNNEVQEAVSAWLTVYSIAKAINEHAALQALAKLAPQLGLEGGLQGWEALLQQAEKKE